MSNKKSSFGLIYYLYIKLINDHVFIAIGAQAIMQKYGLSLGTINIYIKLCTYNRSYSEIIFHKRG